MIVVTGAAGFIGSCMVAKLNAMGSNQLILVDDFSNPDKKENWKNKQYLELVHRDEFFPYLENNHSKITAIIHLGARTNTAELDCSIFENLNLAYSQRLWSVATKYSIPFIYASSAETYGKGDFGYSDSELLIPKLSPLNPYAQSKHEFDKWILKQDRTPPFWVGFKLFNVFGPNEYHKGRMASEVFHAFQQIQKTGNVKLYRSSHHDYADGEQLSDFIYVKDVVNVIYWFLHHAPKSGVYNLGTGYARSYRALAAATFKVMKMTEHIDLIDLPEDMRDNYQYFTEADISKLRDARFRKPFRSLELAVKDYVQQYLSKNKYF